MDSKKIRRGISYFSGWLGLIFCSLIIKVIPMRYLYDFAWGIGSLGYLFIDKQRKIARESLGIAFGGDKSQEEIKQIAKDSFIFMAKSAVEMIFFMERLALLKKRVTFQGKENLDSALLRGKGVILVSAHFGNFPLLMAKLSLERYPIAGIMRPMRDIRTEKFFLAKRNKINIKTIYSQPRSVCIETTIKSLRNNEVVFIPIDQNFGTGGVFVNFFGRKAATATGPVVLAKRTQAAILPCFILRQNDDTHKIIFEPALKLEDGETQEKSTIINIQKLTDIIETYIRRYPREWSWIHRRWKTKPS